MSEKSVIIFVASISSSYKTGQILVSFFFLPEYKLTASMLRTFSGVLKLFKKKVVINMVIFIKGIRYK